MLIASHSHPEFSKGGAEIAAYELYEQLNARADFEAWFLGCDRSSKSDRDGAVLTQPFSEREYVYSNGAFDWFKFANQDPHFPGEIVRLVAEIQPDVAHFHHYINFGVEVFLHLRRTAPDCRIMLTLHEYLGICHHYGQMITPDSFSLCYQSGPSRCTRCFPGISGADFFLRYAYIRRFFDLVDVFISPSLILAERYIAWGVPREKVMVIENVQPTDLRGRSMVDTVRPGSSGNQTLRVGFFGQISMLKGINVMLDAAELLERQGCMNVVFEIYGDHRAQPVEFKKQFMERLEKLPGNVNFHGPYDHARVLQLMRSVDVVLVPSIWWENSPLVIQEAFRAGRPLVCSDIGGMAEKVRDGVDGFHFPVGGAVELANLLTSLAANPAQLRALEANIAARTSGEEALAKHIDLYMLPRTAPTTK